jgi:ribosome recycling factor
MDERLTQYDEKMQKTMNNLAEEFGGIRAGRANPHVLDKIRVDYYGTPSPLQQVANVSVPEPRMIQIQPWEPSLVKVIEKAILTSDLGINPTNDGKVIRLVFPELTEERRKELAKDVKKKGENAKVAIRNIRRDANESLKKLGKSADISEDEIKELEDEAQKLTDKYIAKVDQEVEAKTKEILTV